ncbi:hypothetical protein BXO88_08725 [Oribacterium sp. C9]|uniref:CgeB family protein n=1 Tax=Oribacterium sp. C9 TaxID=1943579 RepID=UPI00098FAF41|nr:glycosyltransferase [Oribacterium sp. C9]OON86125.1 hypothetical protein BXO88_08725 [Oribacterium sp. C9]
MKKIFICNLFKYYTTECVWKGFEKLGCRVVLKDYASPKDKFRDSELESRLSKDIKNVDPEFVFTVNYNPIVSRACYKSNVKYVAWTYDTPMDLPDTDTMDNPTNHIFIFDHGEYMKYRKLGLNTVYYLPLASGFSETFSYHVSDGYLYDVSLVGNLYKATFPFLKEKLDEYHTGFLEGVMTAQRGIYGSYFVLDLLKERQKEVKDIQEITGLNISAEQISYSLAAYMTYLDRLSLMAMFSKRFSTTLFTGGMDDREKEIMKELKVQPKVDYYKEMPEVFRRSRINLNPPFRAVWSAMPQRALDIMSSGGFLLSGYTVELDHYFKNGEELVLYDSIEDAVAKAQFYLQHEELREKIKMAGYEKVKEQFRYEDRLKSIIDTVVN